MLACTQPSKQSDVTGTGASAHPDKSELGHLQAQRDSQVLGAASAALL